MVLLWRNEYKYDSFSVEPIMYECGILNSLRNRIYGVNGKNQIYQVVLKHGIIQMLRTADLKPKKFRH